MTTKGDNHLYGILTTAALNRKFRTPGFNATFLGKISDVGGANDAIANCKIAYPGKDLAPHKAALEVYHQEVEARKPDLDVVMLDVVGKLALWRASHGKEWKLLGEIARGHDVGGQEKLRKRKHDEMERDGNRREVIAGLILKLVAAAKEGDDDKVTELTIEIMMEL
jgi:hypothetical protein